MVLIMDTNNAKNKIIKIKELCSTIISLTALYSNDEEIEYCLDYDKIIDMLEDIIKLQFKRK